MCLEFYWLSLKTKTCSINIINEAMLVSVSGRVFMCGYNSVWYICMEKSLVFMDMQSSSRVILTIILALHLELGPKALALAATYHHPPRDIKDAVKCFKNKTKQKLNTHLKKILANLSLKKMNSSLISFMSFVNQLFIALK